MAKIRWHELCADLTSMTEDEIEERLHEEIVEHKRVAFARRLHQRYTTVRAARERAEIMAKIKTVTK